MDLDKTMEALKKNRYEVTLCETAAEAADYLAQTITGKKIGFGDSATLKSMKLDEKLSANNIVLNPARAKDQEEFLQIAREALTTDIFITSVNALTENGEIVNMDGAGNRIAGSLFGHAKTYFVLGTNKIVSDIQAGIDRIHNIAAPKNAQRKGKKTPCAIKGDKCYNCSSPERICNALTIHLKKMSYKPMEVIIIKESLGF